MSMSTPVPVIHTHRLLLRPVRADDLKVAQAIHGDPQTNRFNPKGPASLETTSSNLFHWVEHWKDKGFGYWAVCDREQPETVLGFGGLQDATFGSRTGLNLYFRFAADAWGKGQAPGAQRSHRSGTTGQPALAPYPGARPDDCRR